MSWQMSAAQNPVCCMRQFRRRAAIGADQQRTTWRASVRPGKLVCWFRQSLARTAAVGLFAIMPVWIAGIYLSGAVWLTAPSVRYYNTPCCKPDAGKYAGANEWPQDPRKRRGRRYRRGAVRRSWRNDDAGRFREREGWIRAGDYRFAAAVGAGRATSFRQTPPVSDAG